MKLDPLGNLSRTHACGDLRAADADADREVVLLGWVQRRRDLGQLIFLDVRDRSGVVQVLANKEKNPAVHARADECRPEYVVCVQGTVARRQKANPNLATGEVEVVASRLRILNDARTPPFPIETEITANEETRLRYRYLDLRRPPLQRNLGLRHRVIFAIRQYLNGHGFYEIETPFLTRSTPEGARDYLVPSRVHPGNFYALPQSPQIFKQLLMIAGFDRYFQIVRCFRDEDLRADRQPEFTQLDLEIAFATRDAVFSIIEGAMTMAFAADGIQITSPFPRLTYAEALARYGTDKPDTRFGMELVDASAVFEAAREALHLELPVHALAAPGAAGFSRKQRDALTEFLKGQGGRALYFAKVTESGVESPLERSLGGAELERLRALTRAQPGDLIVAVPSDPARAAGQPHAATTTLIGALRLQLARELKLKPEKEWSFLWVTDFPLFEWSATENRWVSSHHPFTSPVDDGLELLAKAASRLESSPALPTEALAEVGRVRSQAYDLVLNGWELGSGSIRIHRQDVQQRVFRVLGLTDEEARARFGFFLEALTYGTPPHGGIALGLDRIVALLAGENTIREVIAFPKTVTSQDLMANAPAVVTQEQVEELKMIPAFAYLGVNEKKLIVFNERLRDLIDKKIASRTIPAPTTPFQRMSLLTLTSMYKVARGIVLLAKSGYGHQGQALVRFLVESAINLEYASRDEARASAFWHSGIAAVERFKNKAKLHRWPDDYVEALETRERSEVPEDEWSKIRLRERAKEVDMLWHYDFVYSLSSDRLHPSPFALVDLVQDISRESYFLGPGREWVEEALAGCFIYTFMITRKLIQIFDFSDLSNELDALYKDFHTFTRSMTSDR